MIEDWGWSVEVKIPFKSLRYTAGKGKLWGFNAARNIDRLNDEFDRWLPDDRDISGFLVKHGKLSGLNEIKIRAHSGNRAEYYYWRNRLAQTNSADFNCQ